MNTETRYGIDYSLIQYTIYDWAKKRGINEDWPWRQGKIDWLIEWMTIIINNDDWDIILSSCSQVEQVSTAFFSLVIAIGFTKEELE